MSVSGNGQRHLWTLTLLALVAFGVRVFHLSYQSLWRDEVDALRFATQSWPKLLAMFTAQGHNGPLYFLLLRPWVALSGDSEFALRFFSLFFGVLAVPLIFALGRKLVSPPAGLLAALLAALSPYLAWYAQEVKMYSLIVFLAMLSIYLYLTALQRGGGLRWAAYVVVTSLCLYVHLLAALIIPVEVLWFAISWPRYRRRWRAWLAAVAVLTLPYLPLAVWESHILLSGFKTGHAFYPLATMLTILLLGFSRGISSVVPDWTVVVFVFLFLAGVFLPLPIRARSWRPRLDLLVYLFVPVLGVYLVSLRTPLFTDRYLIYVIPAYFILMATGLLAVRERAALLFALCLALVIAVDGYALWGQTHVPIKSDFRAAAAHVAARHDEGDLVLFLMPYVRHTFEYYYRQPYAWADGPYTNNGMTPEMVNADLVAKTAGRRIVWFVASETWEWDERGLVKGWLDEHGQLDDTAEFARVAVYRYIFEE